MAGNRKVGGRKPVLRVVDAGEAAPARKPKTRGPVLAHLGVTAKEEAFVREVANGASLSDAYRRSHDASDMQDNTLWAQAIKVNSRDRVRARLAALLDAKTAETLHDKRHATAWSLKILQQLAEDADTAGAKVAAVQTVMRYHALLTDRQEVETTDARTTDELREELAAALATLANPPRKIA